MNKLMVLSGMCDATSR